MTIASFLRNDCGVTDDGDRLFPASRPSKPLRGADGCFECLPARSVPARCTRLRRVRHVRNGSRCTRRQRCQAAGPGLAVFIQPLAGVYRSPTDVDGATPQTLHAHTPADRRPWQNQGWRTPGRQWQILETQTGDSAAVTNKAGFDSWLGDTATAGRYLRHADLATAGAWTACRASPYVPPCWL